MCSAPDVPAPPPAPQEAKQPDSTNLKESAKKARSGIVGGSLLTSPSGVPTVATGKTSLLGQ